MLSLPTSLWFHLLFILCIFLSLLDIYCLSHSLSLILCVFNIYSHSLSSSSSLDSGIQPISLYPFGIYCCTPFILWHSCHFFSLSLSIFLPLCSPYTFYFSNPFLYIYQFNFPIYRILKRFIGLHLLNLLSTSLLFLHMVLMFASSFSFSFSIFHSTFYSVVCKAFFQIRL